MTSLLYGIVVCFLLNAITMQSIIQNIEYCLAGCRVRIYVQNGMCSSESSVAISFALPYLFPALENLSLSLNQPYLNEGNETNIYLLNISSTIPIIRVTLDDLEATYFNIIIKVKPSESNYSKYFWLVGFSLSLFVYQCIK